MGLTSVEAKIYLTLVIKGPSLAGVIAKETGIHRRTAYDILYRLRTKGLVTNIIIENKRNFEAVNPERLLEILKEKEETIKAILPEIKGLYKSTKTKNEVLFFRGKQALKTIFDDQIKESREILFMGKLMESNEIINLYFSRFNSRRAEKKIKIKMLLDINSKNKNFVKDVPLSEVKYLNNKNNINMSVYIYGNNISIVVWKDEPIFTIIREKDVADGFRNYFDILWLIAAK